jgi:CBS-domain-containing membrane protein
MCIPSPSTSTGRFVNCIVELPHWSVPFVTFIAALVGVSCIGLVDTYWAKGLSRAGWIGSMGAVSTLLYAAPTSPLVQPRNTVLGNLISAFAGVSVHLIFKDYPDMVWLAGGLAVAFAIVLMQLTKSLHPPGGATGTCQSHSSPMIIELGVKIQERRGLRGLLLPSSVFCSVNRRPRAVADS